MCALSMFLIGPGIIYFIAVILVSPFLQHRQYCMAEISFK